MRAVATVGMFEGTGSLCWVQSPVVNAEIPLEEVDWASMVNSSKIWFQPFKSNTSNGDGSERIVYPHVVPTYVKDARLLDAHCFQGSLPLVSGRAAYYGFWYQMSQALREKDDARVRLLWQCALTVSIKVRHLTGMKEIILYSLHESERTVALKRTQSDSFLTFAEKAKLIIAHDNNVVCDTPFCLL